MPLAMFKLIYFVYLCISGYEFGISVFKLKSIFLSIQFLLYLRLYLTIYEAKLFALCQSSCIFKYQNTFLITLSTVFQLLYSKICW